MARTLPWLKNAPTTISHSSNPRPNKRQRTHDPSSDTEPRPPITTEKQRPTALRSARTPSTSPPPLPPPTSPLRPGLHADDIYIMVEDEFLATARAFTAHLHHAEYLRLKNAAKARSEKAVNGIGTGIERPVDGVTTMRAETRKRKEAEGKEKNVRGAVDSIFAPDGEGRRPGCDGQGEGEGSDISDFEDEGERHDDPWQGTQLQRFMTKSPKKGLKGLTGLQGVVSHTRAAAGFQKPEKRGGSPTPARGVGGMKGRGEEREEEDDDDEDTDDLDAPTYSRPRLPARPTPSTLTKPKPSHPVATTTITALKPPPKPHPKSKPNPPRAFLDVTPLPLHKHPLPKHPPHPQPIINQIPLVKPESHDRGEDVLRGIKERSEARRRRRERERGGRGGEGVRGDEIPVFLV